MGCCLLILVCTISEEFGSSRNGLVSRESRSKLSSTASSSPLKSESVGFYFEQQGDQYSYGWSFILATLGFLGSELSALLCLAAFLNRFDSEVRSGISNNLFAQFAISILGEDSQTFPYLFVVFPGLGCV